jgi:hypothetical protein
MEAESEFDCSRTTEIGCPQEDPFAVIQVLLMRRRPSIRIIAWKILLSRVSVADSSSSSPHHHSCANIVYFFYLNLKLSFSMVRPPSV